MVEVCLVILNDHVYHLLAICQQTSSGKELYMLICFRSNRPLYVYNYDMYSVYFVNLLNKIHVCLNQQIPLNSGFIENSRLTARNPLHMLLFPQKENISSKLGFKIFFFIPEKSE